MGGVKFNGGVRFLDHEPVFHYLGLSSIAVNSVKQKVSYCLVTFYKRSQIAI